MTRWMCVLAVCGLVTENLADLLVSRSVDEQPQNLLLAPAQSREQAQGFALFSPLREEAVEQTPEHVGRDQRVSAMHSSDVGGEL